MTRRGRNRGAGHTKHVSSNEIYIPYPEMRCRISTVLTSLEFHFSAKSLMNQNTVLNVNHVNGEETVNQYRNIVEKIVQLIRRTTPSMNFISDHLINWHGKKQNEFVPIQINTSNHCENEAKQCCYVAIAKNKDWFCVRPFSFQFYRITNGVSLYH